MVVPGPEHQRHSRRLVTQGRELLLAGEPVRLVGYGSYTALTETGVDLEALFGALRRHGLNLHRTWAAQAWARQRESPVFERPDGQPERYDLTTLNPHFIDRLRGACRLAARHGIVLQITLFAPPQCFPEEPDWDADPWNAANNWHGSIEPGRGPTGAHVHELYFNLPRHTAPGSREVIDPALYHLQKDYVQAIVEATAEFWNVIYEMAHEARCYTGVPLQGVLWHREVAGWIKAVDPGLLVSSSNTIDPHLGDPHRISPLEDGIGRLAEVDLISLHYHAWRADNERYIPQALAGTADGCGGYSRYGKPLILDDDGAFAHDETAHRDRHEMLARWAATAIACGAHFHHEDGLPGDGALDEQALRALSAAARPDCPELVHRRSDLLALIR